MGRIVHRWLLVMLALGFWTSNATGQEPELFAQGTLNTAADEYGPVLSADGREVYFTIRLNRSGAERLVGARHGGAGWGEPTTLSFSGGGYDKEPYLSPDGTRLYFASTRETPSGEDLEFEIWVSERDGEGWGPPEHLAEVGSPGYDNYPAVASNSNLYFGSARIEGRGRLFRSEWSGSGYATPEVLVTTDGAPIGGADPYVDPDERFIIFSSTRAGGFGEGDLYLALREGGAWTEPLNLGSIINTASYEYTPFVSADGAYLYFSRDWGEMWRIRVADVASLQEALEVGFDGRSP